jgi:hypothetical protein
MVNHNRPQQVVLAVGRALACWLLVYIALAHVLVVWKWQTPPLPLREEQSVIEKTTTATATVDTTMEQQQQLLLKEQVKVLEATAAQLESAVKNAVAYNVQLEQALAAAHKAAAAANTAAAAADTVDATTETKSSTEAAAAAPASVEHLRAVLQRTNLVFDQDVMSNETLSETLDLALSELQQVIALRDWPSAAHALLLPIAVMPQPRDPIPSVKSSLTVCSKRLSTTRLNQSQVEHAKATTMQTFASQANVAPFLPLSFADSVAHVQDALQRALTNATSLVTARLDQARQLAVAAARGNGAEIDSATAAADCEWTAEQDEQVLAWLDAGLEALHNSANKMDVGMALRQALQADDIDTSTLILNDDLTSSSSRPSDKTARQQRPNHASAPPSTINLGRLLDIPTLHESAVLLDYILQWIHGLHYDMVDDFLDAHLYSKVPDHVTAVGPVAVEYVLQLAGQVEIPLPKPLAKGKSALWP